jgi:hypothetical protein
VVVNVTATVMVNLMETGVQTGEYSAQLDEVASPRPPAAAAADDDDVDVDDDDVADAVLMLMMMLVLMLLPLARSGYVPVWMILMPVPSSSNVYRPLFLFVAFLLVIALYSHPGPLQHQ